MELRDSYRVNSNSRMDLMNAAGSAMPVLGLLTGVSYVSGVDYFRGINEKVAAKMPSEFCVRMQKNARLVLACVDW